MGDTSLLAQSTEKWSHKRKALAPTFYKEKLFKMMDIVKSCVGERMQAWKVEFADAGKPMDLVAELSKVHAKTILSCIFSSDLSEEMVPFSLNGVVT